MSSTTSVFAVFLACVSLTASLTMSSEDDVVIYHLSLMLSKRDVYDGSGIHCADRMTRSATVLEMPTPCALEEEAWRTKKTWLSTVRADLEPMGGFKKHGHRWNRQWIQLIEPIALEREQWRDACRQILDATMGLDKART